MARLAVLISGTGSLLQAMLDDGLVPDLVIADRPCRGFGVAYSAAGNTQLIERNFGPSFDREAYTREVLETLALARIDLIAMAGFRTVFTQTLFDAYEGRVLNTHPSLLPDFKGGYAVRDALNAGVLKTGCTIHLATAAMDEGPVIAQYDVPILPGDDVEALHERIKEEERRHYPRIIKERLALLYR